MRDVAPFRAQIDALNLASRRPCPFATFEYTERFLAHDEYGARDEELLFLTAFDGDALVGYLPLRKHRDHLLKIPYGRIDVLLSHAGDRPHVVARAEDEARCSRAFYSFLLDRERGWSFLELAMQDSESALDTLPPLNPARFYARRYENMPNTTIQLHVASFAEYFNAIAGGQRKNMARLCRRLLAAGNVEVVQCVDPAARSALLDLYLDLERRSWKEAAHAGIRRDPRRVDFFRSLCEPDQPLAIGFDFVLLDGLPISALVSGTFAGTMHAIEMCFDREYEDLGPGHLLSLMAIRRAIDSGLHAVNFNGNYAYYKARLGGVITETRAVQIYKVGSLPWIKARGGELKRRLRPPSAPAEAFNPERRRVTEESDGKTRREQPARSPKVEERERAQKTLADLEARGAEIVRSSGDALDRALPFSTRREAA